MSRRSNVDHGSNSCAVFEEDTWPEAFSHGVEALFVGLSEETFGKIIMLLNVSKSDSTPRPLISAIMNMLPASRCEVRYPKREKKQHTHFTSTMKYRSSKYAIHTVTFITLPARQIHATEEKKRHKNH